MLAILNSPVNWWFLKATSTDLQNGFIQALLTNQTPIPIPAASDIQQNLTNCSIRAIEAGGSDNRLEQLLNGFVYELFFKEDLHARGLSLFDEAERAGLSNLADLGGTELVKAAESFAAIHLIPGATLRTMLSDLATLDVVRIIEGRE